MKKFLIAYFPTYILLSGCSVNFNIGTENTSQTTVSEAFTTSRIEISTVSAQAEENAAVNSVTEEELRRLMEKNIYCNLNIFAGSLPLENKDYVFDENDTVQQVDADVFGSYSEFEEYVRSVYCKETADMLLYDYPYEGDPKYLDIGGDLFLNTLYSGEKGYYVDWTDFTVIINYADEAECGFTVKASAEYPGEAAEAEDYIKESKAVLEKGKWLLSEMIY